MDKNSSAAGWNALEVMMISFVVAAAAAAVLLTNFNGQGRLWDALSRRDDFGSSRTQMISRFSPPDPGGSHIMVAKVVPEPEPQAAAPVPAPAAAAPAPAPAKNSWMKHISGSLNTIAISGQGDQHSSASASVADAPAAAPSAAPAGSAPMAVASARAPAPAATAQPAYVNYGGSTRSDIMSSASGPVYNFAGKKR
jgi:hypothetical protein